MTDLSKRILIAGGGPGGLVAAVALLQAGFDPIVFERAPTLDGGTAFTLWPNALRALDSIGMGDALRSISFRFDGLAMRERRGKTLFQIDGERLRERFGYSGVAVERRRFLEVAGRKADICSNSIWQDLHRFSPG